MFRESFAWWYFQFEYVCMNVYVSEVIIYFWKMYVCYFCRIEFYISVDISVANVLKLYDFKFLIHFQRYSV